MNDKINGIIVSDKVYVPTVADRPCIECDVHPECQNGMMMGRLCSIISEDECFKFSQELTDKLNKQ